MLESEFLLSAERAMNGIEAALERVSDQLDVEFDRRGNVLEIELVRHASKIIVNSQAPMQQLWVAAKSGGFHFKYDGSRWIDTRSGSELFEALSKIVSEQAGTAVILNS